jgi:hypothetical protein
MKKRIRADKLDIKNLTEHLLPGYQSNRLTNQEDFRIPAEGGDCYR